MAFLIKRTKQKTSSSYKSLYLPQSLIDQIDAISQQNQTSFNNVVVSMIEHCLEEDEPSPGQ